MRVFLRIATIRLQARYAVLLVAAVTYFRSIVRLCR